MRRLRKYLALSPSGRRIVLYSLLLLPLVAALLRARGMEHTRAWLTRHGRFAAGDTSALAPREIATLVGAAAALLRARCLSRSLLLCHLLHNRGASVEIRLGVTKHVDGSLSAHAWVEFDGLPLIDGLGVSKRYAALPLRGGVRCSGRPSPQFS